MRSENDTSVVERFLCLEGFVSTKALAQVAAGLPESKPEKTEAFFVQSAYADLPIGREFQVVFLKSEPKQRFNCPTKVMAVTQQFAKPFKEIPHGWKTICYVQFPSGMPELLKRLPTVDSWYQNQDVICLSSFETWQAFSSRIAK